MLMSYVRVSFDYYYYLYKKLSLLSRLVTYLVHVSVGCFCGYVYRHPYPKKLAAPEKRKKPDLASVRASLMRISCSEKIGAAVIDAVSSEACLVSY